MTRSAIGSTSTTENLFATVMSSDEPAAASAAGNQPATTESIGLNTALHLRLLQSGAARPSTYASAMGALEELRRKRGY